MDLEARGIGVVRQDRTVLDALDLEVRSGSVVAILGPSGIGKTTLLHVLCGLVAADSGEVFVGSTRLSGASGRERDRVRRQSFGFVQQLGDLVPELSVQENVSLPLRLNGISAFQAMAAAADQLDALGIAHLAERAPADISGGELQRAAVARAVVHRPGIILADEPTGSLDDENASVVVGLLQQEARVRDAAVVLVTHQGWIARMADRQLSLVGGSLVEACTATG